MNKYPSTALRITQVLQRSLLFLALAVVCSASLVGCNSKKPIDADTLASAQTSYDSAVVKIEEEDYDAAASLLDAALAPGGGLPPDIYTMARIERAKCFARLERFDEAHADLDVAAQGSANMALVHVARAFVFKGEGKTASPRKKCRPLARSTAK